MNNNNVPWYLHSSIHSNKKFQEPFTVIMSCTIFQQWRKSSCTQSKLSGENKWIHFGYPPALQLTKLNQITIRKHHQNWKGLLHVFRLSKNCYWNSILLNMFSIIFEQTLMFIESSCLEIQQTTSAFIVTISNKNTSQCVCS